MSIILKPLFEILTGDIAICDHVICNYLFIWAIGKMAYLLAYDTVGNLYFSGVIHGRSAGSAAHWTIRFFIYIGVAYLLRALIWIYNLWLQFRPKFGGLCLAYLLQALSFSLYIALHIGTEPQYIGDCTFTQLSKKYLFVFSRATVSQPGP